MGAQIQKDSVSKPRPFFIQWLMPGRTGLAAKDEVLWAADGTPLRMIGVNDDITKRKPAERRIRGLVEEMLRRQKPVIHSEERMRRLKMEVNELLARQGQAGRFSVAAASIKEGK